MVQFWPEIYVCASKALKLLSFTVLDLEDNAH